MSASTMTAPPSQQMVLAVYEDELPAGVLGYSAPEGVVWIDPDQFVAQRAESLLHEIFHVLLGHDGPPSEGVEQAVEDLCIATAHALQQIGPIIWEPQAFVTVS